jgi:uncharacterized membrane protein
MLRFIGQFHPAIVHFPIALLVAAMVFEALAWATGKKALHHAGVLNLHLGALSALATALIGWAFASTMGMEPDLKPTLELHRWTGIAAVVWALVALATWHWHRLRNREEAGWPYRITLVIGAILVGVAGHLGGLLVYGLDFYTWKL